MWIHRTIILVVKAVSAPKVRGGIALITFDQLRSRLDYGLQIHWRDQLRVSSSVRQLYCDKKF